MESENKDTQLIRSKTGQVAQEQTPLAVEEPKPDAPGKDNKLPRIAIYILTAILLITLGVFGYWFYQQRLGLSREESKTSLTPHFEKGCTQIGDIMMGSSNNIIPNTLKESIPESEANIPT